MKVGRFVDGLKAAGAEFFAGVPDSSLKSFCTHETDCCVVKMLLHHFYSTNGVRPFGPHLSILDVARPPRPCRKGEGALATACSATTYHNVFFIPKNCIKNVCPLKPQWK